MHCSECGTESTTGRKFCAACGSPLRSRCSKCGAENAPSSAFCEDCGAALADNAASAASGSPQVASTTRRIRVTPDRPDASTTIEGERKTVTALFADLKGSTELMKDLDPEEARAIIDPALHIMIDAVRRFEGYVVQSTGDGIFALFGAPAAYEDHPQRALYAALQIQQELREHGQRRVAQGTHPLVARVGVNTGEVVVRSVEIGGKVEYTPIGHTANLASRLQTVAPAGSIAVSEHTRNLCEGYFELRSIGPTAVRGIGEAIDVYEVTGLGTLRTHFELSTRRGLTKFVGRETEFEQMQGALDLATAGRGQIVAVMADAGTGKSRLFHEFKAALPAEYKLLEAYSVSHGKASAWLPVLELLRGYFGIADADDAASRREKVRTALAALDPTLSETQPYLFALLGIPEVPDPIAQMDPQIKRRRTLEAIKRVTLRESLNQPLVLIFEDLHWIDEQTQELLDMFADSIAKTRILLLVNYRPEYRHAWGNKRHYVQIGLQPLGQDSAEELLTALLGEASELQPLKRLIIERAGGNPFFIEEMIQALFDEGALVRDGTVKVTRPLSQLRLPPTVQGMLAARIDRLSPAQKELLQTLAVIGRESPHAVISKMTETAESQLERKLAELRAAEFIYEQTSVAGIEYTFKHALTQEVAYNSLLIERRKLLHDRAGQALEAIFTDQLDDHLTQLAHHFSLSNNFDKAVEYLGRSGQQALQRSANAAAIANLKMAIELLQKLPDNTARMQRELNLQLALGPALIAINGWAAPEVERAFIRVRELCESMGDPPEVSSALFGLYAVYHVRGQSLMAHELAQELLRRAQRNDDQVLLMCSHLALGDTLFELGEYSSAKEHFDVAIAMYDPARHRALAYGFIGLDILVNCLSYSTNALWYLGYPDQALKQGNEALAVARGLSHPHSLAFAENLVGNLRIHRREVENTKNGADRLIEIAAEQGFAMWAALGKVQLGWAMAASGQTEKGIAHLQEGLAAFRLTGAEIGWPYWLSLLAEAYIEGDRLDEAQGVLAEALAAADNNENRGNESETSRLRGKLLLRQNDSNAAEAQICFQRAIAVARRQNAKSLELRATTSFARLLHQQGRRDAARVMLAEIYNWFTEGFDTVDLKEAKVLLDQLSV